MQKYTYKAKCKDGKMLIFNAVGDQEAREHGKKEHGRKISLERLNCHGLWVPIIKNGKRIRDNEFITQREISLYTYFRVYAIAIPCIIIIVLISAWLQAELGV